MAKRDRFLYAAVCVCGCATIIVTEVCSASCTRGHIHMERQISSNLTPSSETTKLIDGIGGKGCGS